MCILGAVSWRAGLQIQPEDYERHTAGAPATTGERETPESDGKMPGISVMKEDGAKGGAALASQYSQLL